MGILNYSTQVPVDKTIGEITQKLMKAGAISVTMNFDQELQFHRSISFTLVHRNSPLIFVLDCKFEGILQVLEKEKKRAVTAKVERDKLIAQAKRVAWRIQKDWLEVQLALVEADLATIIEVFLAKVVTKNGTTMAQMLNSDDGMKLLYNGGE